MAGENYVNGAPETSITGAITETSVSATTISLTGYPAVPFYGVLGAGTGSEEVVRVTNITGTTVTMQRGFDGTIAVSHPAGETFNHGGVAMDLRKPNQHVDFTQNVHGATGDIVGTTGTQTLQSKTFQNCSTSGALSGQFSGQMWFGDLLNEAAAKVAMAGHPGAMCYLSAPTTWPNEGVFMLNGATVPAMVPVGDTTTLVAPAKGSNEVIATTPLNVSGALTVPSYPFHVTLKIDWGASYQNTDPTNQGSVSLQNATTGDGFATARNFGSAGCSSGSYPLEVAAGSGSFQLVLLGAHSAGGGLTTYGSSDLRFVWLRATVVPSTQS